MEQVLVAVTGPDSFGVVYTAAAALNSAGCSIVDMNQTTVRNQFSAIMVVDNPKGLSNEELARTVEKGLDEAGFDMAVTVRDFVPGKAVLTAGDPFVITVDGSDCKDILLAFTRIFYEGRVNIDSFRSIEIAPESAGASKRELFVFEVTVPPEIDRKSLHRTLADIVHERKLSMSMQHRKIFEAVHRVTSA